MFNKLRELQPSRIYLVLLGIFVVTYVWRATSIGWADPISSHISNFAITGAAVILLIGPKDFRRKSARNKVLQITITFAVANIIVELLNVGDLQLPGLTFLSFNTADIFDAVYGLIAVVLATFFYWREAK